MQHKPNLKSAEIFFTVNIILTSYVLNENLLYASFVKKMKAEK